MDNDGKSSIGFEEGVVATASYFCFTGLILLMIERKSNFVRFHSVQSCLGFGLLAIYWLIVKWIGALYFLTWTPGLLALMFSCYMMIRAYHGEEYKFPVIGEIAFSAIYDTDHEAEDPLPASSASDDSKS